MRKKKTTDFNNDMKKSVFLYGKPNACKIAFILDAEKIYVNTVNKYIELLFTKTTLILPIVLNDKKGSELRAFEKEHRLKINSAYSQNAFDEAVTKLSNRLDDIRLDMCSLTYDIFVQSKTLFALSAAGASKDEMLKVLSEYKGSSDLISKLKKFKDFELRQNEFAIQYQEVSAGYKIPFMKKAALPIDSRIGSLEKSTDTEYPYVAVIGHPAKRGERITVPVDTTKKSLRRLDQYKKAGTFFVQIRGNSLKVTCAFEKKINSPERIKYEGVDIGITDALHTTKGAIGSLQPVIDFYKDTVEPAFADLSDLRNKKRNIRHYLHTHDLSDDVRRSLIAKMDRLEDMIKRAKAPFRKKRHYYQMLDQTIKEVVDMYINSIDKNTFTVLEKLDIRNFNKSRKVNSMFSMFARGKLSGRLMQQLNWHGYDFAEVDPTYTSQICPICGNISQDNRIGKNFKCTNCGHEDDADHNAAMNIRKRFHSEELLEILKNKHTHRQKADAIKEYYSTRHGGQMNYRCFGTACPYPNCAKECIPGSSACG